jgi:hypothetical protein
MAVVTLKSQTLLDTEPNVTSDNAAANRPHRYNQIEVCVGGVDLVAGPRPGPDQPLTVPPTWVTLAAWCAAREGVDTNTDTAALSWAR